MTARANPRHLDDLTILDKLVTEKDLLAAVREKAKSMGFLCYHTLNSMGSEPGFPDLTLVTVGRVVFMELKREGLKPTINQVRWLNDLARAGAEVYLVFPSDWRRGDVARILTADSPKLDCRWVA